MTQILKIENQTAQDWGASPVWVCYVSMRTQILIPITPKMLSMAIYACGENKGSKTPELNFQSNSGSNETACLKGIDEG